MNRKEPVKIDGPKKTIIRNDWLKEFPTFGKETECSISKRIGPILMSIGWDIRYQAYRPGSSICNLMRVEKNLYASLSCEPKSRRESLSWEQHEKGLYKEAVAELREYSPVPLEGPLKLSQLLEAYKNSRHEGMRIYENDPRLEDPILIIAWTGKEDLARDVALDNANYWKSLYINHEDERKEIWLSEIDEWHEEMLQKISDTHHLNVLIEEAIVKYKLAKLPYEDLIIDL